MKKTLYFAMLYATLHTFNAYATVVIEGTRFVYPENKNDISVKMKNTGAVPALMQVWVDKGNPKSNPKNADAPFILTPPIFRLNSGEGQAVRIMFIQEKLPSDRESLFYFNALEVPPMPESKDNNFMQVAIRSRLKLFYRPAHLQMERVDALKNIKWSITNVSNNSFLTIDNNSPYYITYSSIELSNRRSSQLLGALMIAPYSHEKLHLNPSFAGGRTTIKYRTLNDFGLDGYKTTFIE
ncbi:molecular chaperone [Klebsiella aerogenes]